MIFYITLVVYFYTGMYVYHLNPKDRIHQVFFYLGLSSGLWAFSYSLMNHAVSAEGANYAFLLSALGLGTFYSLILHLILLYLNPQLKLKKKQILALYLPVPITFILFFHRAIGGHVVENLLSGSGGWRFYRPDLLIDRWMTLYFLTFMGLSLYLMVKRLLVVKDGTLRKEALFMILGMSVSLVIGLLFIFGITRTLRWNHLFIGSNQQFLLMIILYRILSLRGRKIRNDQVYLPKRGEFLSKKTHEKIFFYVSQVYILGAFVSFGIEVLINHADITRSSLLAGIMFLAGVFIFFMNKSGIDSKTRDNLIFLVMSLTIPFISVYQISSSATFAWTTPVIFILVAVAFNNTKLLTITSIITMATMISLWILKPRTFIHFTGVEHFARMTVFLIVIFLAYLINRIYKNRLEQFERQIDHERFISEMAMILSMARNKNLRSNLDVFLEKSVKYMDADYGCIHVFSAKEKKIRKIDGYGRYDLTGIKNNWFFSKEIDGLMKHLAGGKLSEGEFIGALEGFKQDMQEKGVSLILTPLEESGKILGVMCMGTTKGTIWDEGYHNTFMLIANSLSSMLYKIRNEDELFRMAYYDALTGLPNRVLFDKMVTQLIKDSVEGERFALIFLDLDDFKNINDLMGHSVGDQFLVEMAKRLKPVLKKDHLVSRFGGDEFLIVLPHVQSKDEIHTFAEDILKAITRPMPMDDREVTTGASLGISIYPKDGDSVEDLIRYADLAMYISKSSGKNRYTLCTEEIKSRFIMEKELESDLHKAMVKNEFVLHYQAKVHGVTEEICGVEALIRWKHPEKGMIFPGDFLPIAERIGIMPQIDDWVFVEACNQNLKWQDMGYEKIPMSINITPISLMDNDFDLDLLTLFRRRRWDPEYIEVEVTENTMYLSMESIKRNLMDMRNIGITISLDDFGTAYSSLSRLHVLPIDKVKIDRQFIVNLDEGGRNLYDGVLNLSRSLGLAVTVEGVETKEQADYIRSKGCEEIQGYYYYKPMVPEELEKYFKKASSLESIPKVHEMR